MNEDRPLRYIDGFLEARRRGLAGDHIHFGLWDNPPPDGPMDRASFEQAQERLAARHLDLADLGDGQTLVDVGCGVGGLLRMADRRLQRAVLAGVNIDRRQLALCERLVSRRGNRLAWHAADACRLPVADGMADRVLSVEAAFHFADRGRFLAEAARILKPGGLLVVSDILLDPAGMGGRAQALAGLLARDFGPWPEPWLDARGFLAQLRQAGLEPEQVLDLGAATLPSYRFMTGAAALAREPQSGLEALRTFHEGGRLVYLLVRARRAA